MLERWIGAFGVLVLLGIAYLTCPRALRSHVRWRTVGWGMALLLGFAVVVLKTPARVAFDWASAVVNRMLEFSAQGAAFVFGGLVTETDKFGFVFAFQVLPTIVFFGALMSLLYYLGVMPFVIDRLARLIARSLGTSGAESVSTVADIFVGQSEAPLVIRPYIATLTRSELMACMTAGFATTAGAVLAAYVLMLKDHVPEIAGHLIACSVMSAPASLVIAKLMLPESETPTTRGDVPVTAPHPASGAIDAVAIGTLDGLRLAANVAAMLISFLALVALVNFCLDWAGRTLLDTPLSLERLLGWLFAPLAFVMDVPTADVTKVASLLGQKTVLNEFVAYTHMSQALAADPGWLSERGRVIASYALCGFANFGSVGIQIGGYSGLAPERRADIAALGLRAMIGGVLTTCLVATVAGILY
jgi:CNT family concentrative nucleoside transporter